MTKAILNLLLLSSPIIAMGLYIACEKVARILEL